MVANSTPGGCSGACGGSAPRFPWSDMALLCFIMIGAALTGAITFVMASEAVASGLEWLGYPQAEGSAYLRFLAFLAGALAAWRTGLSAAHKVQEMGWSTTFMSRENVITYFAASAVAVAMGVTMWWLTKPGSGWPVPSADHAFFTAVTAVLIPVVLAWVVVAHFAHERVNR